jgi:hypothetical protein
VILLKVDGKLKLSKKIAGKDGDWDLKGVINEILDLKKRFPDTKGLVLSGTDNIEYGEIVRAMEALKPHLQAVLLGGL